MKLHHIGIVAKNGEEAGKNLCSFIPFDNVGEMQHVLSQQVTIQLFQTGNIFLEIISPDSMESKIYKYAKKGGGFHHLCFEVDNVGETFRDAIKKGAKPIIYPVIGFENRITAFIFLPFIDPNFNLIELAEKKHTNT